MKIVTDIMLVIGMGSVAYGAWLLDPAAGLITGGALLLAAGLARGRAEAFADHQNKRGTK